MILTSTKIVRNFITNYSLCNFQCTKFSMFTHWKQDIISIYIFKYLKLNFTIVYFSYLEFYATTLIWASLKHFMIQTTNTCWFFKTSNVGEIFSFWTFRKVNSGIVNSFDLGVAVDTAFGYRNLPRKEVIQPHLPVRLPCYDFTPVTNPALGRCLQKVSSRTSGVVDSHGVTGGVYKTRERIQRSVLICVY